MKPLIPLLLCFANAAQACEGLAAAGAWVREPPPGSVASAAFFTLSNTSAQAVSITGWEARGFGSTMLHETVVEGSTARMVMREKLLVEAGRSIELRPGGLHLMLMKPAEPVRSGSSVSVTLSCAQGSMVVEAPVLRDSPR